MADAVSGASIAPTTSSGRFAIFPRQVRLALLAGLLALAAVAVEMPAAAQGHSSEAARIVRIAASHIGARFRMGATGPRYFDCSGFIYRVYKQAGLLNRIGGRRRLVAGYYHWFHNRGLASRHNPRVGDLVIWTHHGTMVHSGIYVGNGRVISALINPWGVKRTYINALHVKFFAFLHVRLTR